MKRFLLLMFVSFFIVATGMPIRSVVGARTICANGQDKEDVLTWIEDSYYDTFGAIQQLEGASRCEEYIKVTGGHTIKFYLGKRPKGITLFIVQYNKNLVRIDSTYSGNGFERTSKLNANCEYIKIAAETASIDVSYIYDETDGRYIMKDGRLP